MPIPSPFYERTGLLCTSMNWKDWAGYYAVASFDTVHIPEYFAFRQSAGLIDVTPLFKYKVTGPDAAAFLSRVMVKNIDQLKVGRVAYLCWCNDQGKVIDDGTVMHVSEHAFFVTSADPSFLWLSRFTRGYDTTIEDVTDAIAGLALQGPTSRDILKNCVDVDMDALKFFEVSEGHLEGIPVHVSRTGFTGDLGYEIWTENEHSIKLWDALMKHGKNYNIRPCGLDALDMTRIEAGLILNGADYFNAAHVLIEDRMSTPYELGLGWTVNLDRSTFNGQAALKREKEKGSLWATVGLDINWPELEAIYNRYGLPPEVDGHAWRTSIPIYDNNDHNKQVGYATSGTWSPTLKKNIAIATIQKAYGAPGTKIQFEVMVEHTRHLVSAFVGPTQFYNPERKRSNPGLVQDVVSV
ncbi:MAG: aminomethyltransferase family protein [Flavobacteriales bacterium]|nr:aminomethyltransferase family protein [Flavobacteriales bacterium]